MLDVPSKHARTLAMDVQHCLTEVDIGRFRVDLSALRLKLEAKMPVLDWIEVTVQATRDEGKLLWEKLALEDVALKRERYVIYAILIRESITKTLDNRSSRPPFGLMHEGKPIERFQFLQEGPDVYQQLENIMADTLLGEVRNLVAAIHDQPDKPNQPNELLVTAVKRFAEIEGFIDPAWKQLGRTLPERFAGGFTNASAIMARVLRLLPQVYTRDLQRQPDLNELLAIAQASHPLLVQLAKLDFNIFISAISEVAQDALSFDPNDFILKAGHPPQLALKKEQRLKELLRSHPGMCPALISFEGLDSAIKQLWDWHCNLAEHIYGQIYA